jgi:hypothetical protein
MDEVPDLSDTSLTILDIPAVSANIPIHGGDLEHHVDALKAAAEAYGGLFFEGPSKLFPTGILMGLKGRVGKRATLERAKKVLMKILRVGEDEIEVHNPATEREVRAIRKAGAASRRDYPSAEPDYSAFDRYARPVSASIPVATGGQRRSSFGGYSDDDYRRPSRASRSTRSTRASLASDRDYDLSFGGFRGDSEYHRHSRPTYSEYPSLRTPSTPLRRRPSFGGEPLTPRRAVPPSPRRAVPSPYRAVASPRHYGGIDLGRVRIGEY